jgi:hypothetical protein
MYELMTMVWGLLPSLPQRRAPPAALEDDDQVLVELKCVVNQTPANNGSHIIRWWEH